MNRKGQALAVAYTIIAVFMVIASSLLYGAVSERHLVQREQMRQEAFYLAEGAVEYGIQNFSSAIADYQIPPDSQTYTVNAPFTGYGGIAIPVTITRLENTDRLLFDNQTNILVMNFKVSARAVHPLNTSIAVTVSHIVARRLIPTFQHAVFYNDDLEMLPGPDMTLSGRIHCNRDIYMDSHNTLTLDSAYVRSAGDMFNNRKDTNEELEGDVAVKVIGSPSFQNMNNLDCENPGWTQMATERWMGTMQSAAHGVTKLTAPSVASIQPAGYYAGRAKVVITNSTIVKEGKTLQPGIDCPTGTVMTATTLYNNREGKYMKTTDIDLRKLAGYAPGDQEGKPSFPNNLPSNGLLYATRGNASLSQEPAVRLKNASTIYRSAGLTVVSNDPVYVQGNYNTADEKPTAIICDSLNILSNNWSDAKSSSVLDARLATVTTVNSAFITGVDTTVPGRYNGGLENYPRFLENWTGIPLNIKGSFVELWESQVAHGAWLYGSPQYTAPTRNWHYNTAFNNAANLPPFTPWAVEILRLVWWKE